MAIYNWPAGRAYTPALADMWLPNTDITTDSVLGGGQQTAGVPGAHWQMALTFSKNNSVDRLQLLGFLRSLNGKEHRVRLSDFRKFGIGNVQGVPGGTIATSGVTIKTTVVQFGIAAVLAGCGAGATLNACDMWSVNGQLIENSALATANGIGDMTVAIPERLRAQVAAGAVVSLVQPTALYVLKDTFHGVRERDFYGEMVVEFEEVFA